MGKLLVMSQVHFPPSHVDLGPCQLPTPLMSPGLELNENVGCQRSPR